jgi:sentrin-specific protease 8
MKDTHVQARDGRKNMLKVIEERKKEGERRRSYVYSLDGGDAEFGANVECRRSHSPYRESPHSKSPPRIGEENESLKTT